ncbi:MAG: RecB family exonuclease [Jatrophihabitans sp.]|nr:MAG: RecB family exonuclease [Jatrophihabitans sp.]
MSASAASAVITGSLSPSRAADFKTCPLLYRFRCIDRLPQAPSRVATRGTLVHAVLEKLFDLPAAQRTLAAARDMVPGAWQELLAEDADRARLFEQDVDGAQFAEWITSTEGLLANYFALEDPRRLEPEAREQLVECDTGGVRLRGYVDRIDVSPAGDIRVVDYKTGTTPREAFEGKALFQLKFYALVLWRTRGVVPRQLRLMYLSDTDTLTYAPDGDELARFERTLTALWAAIERAVRTRTFPPSPSRLCDWCDHQALCPAFGGTPPPFPEGVSLTTLPEDRPAAQDAGAVRPGSAAAVSPSPPP